MTATLTSPWRKVLRDFWGERTRSVLVIVAIAIGASAVFAILASYAILTRELDRGYMATNPASATLTTDVIDDDLLRAVLANHAVSDAEPRRVVSARLKAGPMKWRSVVLFVVRDYANIRVSTLQREHGAWPPGPGEILIERDALGVVHAGIGDVVSVRMADGREHPLKVTGSVHDVGQAQARMENMVYGYITTDTLALLGETPRLNQLKILVAERRLDKAHIESVAAEVKRLFESRGHPVTHLDIPRPGKHPHADIMGLLLLSMSTFGLFVLLLSGVLVANLLIALMASQVRQIAVMKTVGATRGQIARLYFAYAMLLGGAGVLVAVPLGLWGMRLLCRYQAAFLNFDIASFAVPFWVYLAVAVVGVLVPLGAAAVPVWRGSGLSIREALADYGVSRNAFGATLLDRLLANVSGAARPLLFALRNSFRRRTRLAMTVVTLAAGGLFFMTALNVRASFIKTLDVLFRSRPYDLSVSLGKLVPLDVVERAVRKTPGVVRMEGWVTDDGLIAIPADTTMLRPNFVDGRMLRAGDGKAVMINSALANTNGKRVGSLYSGRRVVGIMREPFTPAMAYVLRDGSATNSIRLVLQSRDADAIDRVKAALETNLSAEGVRVRSSLTQAEGRFAFDQHMVMIYVFLITMSAIIGLVGGLGLMTTMSLNVLERRREMGVLRAIGAAPSTVGWIVVAEAVVIGVLSWALATMAAWPVSKGIGDLMVKAMFRSGLDFSFQTSGPVVWLIVSIVLAALSGLIPAWQAAKAPVREALGYE